MRRSLAIGLLVASLPAQQTFVVDNLNRFLTIDPRVTRNPGVWAPGGTYRQQPVAGTVASGSLRVRTYATAGSSIALFVSLPAAPRPWNGELLWLDPTSMVVVGSGTASGLGTFDVDLTVPPGQWPGVPLTFQAVLPQAAEKLATPALVVLR